MTTPAAYGGLGIAGHGLGRWGLGGPQPAQSFALPVMGKTAVPYIAHLYDHNMVFKATFGGAKIVNKPGLKATTNGGYQVITLELSDVTPGAFVTFTLGDVIRLSEQGDSIGTILFSGNVETTPEQTGVGGTHHLVTVTPWITELAGAYFDMTYATPVDVAQFVRDAVAATAHCSVSPISCPNTGITAIYDFQQTNGLDAIHVAKQIAGADYFYFCDDEGVVWFQSVNTTNPATVTLIRGVDYNDKKASSTIVGQTNKIVVIGGSLPGDPGRITSIYDGLVNQVLYGVRSFNPTPSYPTVTDQATLDLIAASLGAQFDRVPMTVELAVPALGRRLTPGRPGGITVRFFESNKNPLKESATGSGGYSGPYVLQDNQMDGPSQAIVVGDIPYSDSDTTYEATRIAQRTSTIAAVAMTTPAVAPPPLPPPPPPTPIPVVTKVAAKATIGSHLFGMGAGTFVICQASFTTPIAVTVQLEGALDCRMDYWSSYQSPTRDVWCEIVTATGTKGIIYTMPFAITRVTATDGNNVNNTTLPAGTYTVRWMATMKDYCQLRVYSGYCQAITTG